MYKYVKINGRYFCLQQNVFYLVWYLCLYQNSLLLHFHSQKAKFLQIIRKIVQFQIHSPQTIKIMELSIFGNICLQVHRGFKIFNFRDKKVTKIFSKNEKYDNIVKEIQAVRWASKLEFAPKIDQSDTEKRWYEEEFIIGKPCYYLGTTSETKAFQNIYPKHVVPCLEKMILLKRPLFVKTKDYVHRTAKILSDPKLKTKEINNSRLTLILNFISNLKEQICNEGNFKIPLVFSHGDFSLVNILKTKTGIKVIDWEAASIRNPLNDLYNYFFTELYYKRAVNGLAQDVENAIFILQKRLCVRAPELWKNLVELSEFYRRLYYLERICLLLERKLTDKVIDVILRSIEIFKYYEKLKI